MASHNNENTLWRKGDQGESWDKSLAVEDIFGFCAILTKHTAHRRKPKDIKGEYH